MSPVATAEDKGASRPASWRKARIVRASIDSTSMSDLGVRVAEVRAQTEDGTTLTYRAPLGQATPTAMAGLARLRGFDPDLFAKRIAASPDAAIEAFVGRVQKDLVDVDVWVELQGDRVEIVEVDRSLRQLDAKPAVIVGADVDHSPVQKNLLPVGRVHLDLEDGKRITYARALPVGETTVAPGTLVGLALLRGVDAAVLTQALAWAWAPTPKSKVTLLFERIATTMQGVKVGVEEEPNGYDIVYAETNLEKIEGLQP